MGKWHSGHSEISLVEDRREVVVVEGGGWEGLGGWHVPGFAAVADAEAVAGGTLDVVSALESHGGKNLQRGERRRR